MWLENGVVLLLCLRIISGSVCEVKESCGTCITFEKAHCVWCPSKTHNSSRCKSQSDVQEMREWCLDEVIDPQSKIKVIEENNKNGMQFTPKHLNIQIRPIVPVNFTITYKPVEDQPLDVYILIDNSGSMEKLKAELSKIVNDLYQELTRESNNVHFGVGSFSEKPAKPYVISRPDTYSFRNDLKLGMNISAFIEAIDLMKSVKNSDEPEAGLDALMQVMVCDEEIGWRKEARHLIVYCSDANPHTVGDGKMVGTIQPNDMKCHLMNNIHSTALEYDYPSIGQLNKIAHDKEITIFFVIKTHNYKIKQTYKRMSELIKGAQFASMMYDKEIAKIIINKYKKMKETLIVTYNKLPEVTLDLSPDCTQNNNRECKISLNENITINAQLTMNNCPKNGYKTTFMVGPMGLYHEKLQIDLEGLCNCDCENKRVNNASECHKYGTYQCGICECNEGRSGENCECDNSVENTFQKRCKDDFCSERGKCKCGICHCYKGYAGEICELSDYDCKFFNGKICAGNGICSKSQCLCDNGWTNEDCSCSSSVSSCFSNGSSEICSNNGRCICNQCECKKGYSGPTCSYCTECARKTCKDLKEYANCIFIKNQSICDVVYFQLTREIDSKLISREEMNSYKNMSIMCKDTFENGSEIIFTYQLAPKKWILMVQNILEPPLEASILAPVAATIGSIIFGGLLLLLIWKFTLQYLDKKEYRKFEAEVKSSGLNVCFQNPTYVNPVVTFQNPRYRHDSNT